MIAYQDDCRLLAVDCLGTAATRAAPSTIETSSITRMSASMGFRASRGISAAVEAEQPVNRAGLVANNLFEPLGRLARGGAANTTFRSRRSAMLVMVETAYVFATARTSCHQRDGIGERAFDGVPLLRIQFGAFGVE